MLELIQNADWMILNGIRDIFKCNVLDFIMPRITMLGNGDAIWLASAVGLMFSKKYRKYGFVMIRALAVGVLACNICLKPLIARPRPCWIENTILLIGNPGDYSFPSGHTLSSVIGAFILTAANWKFGFIAVPMAVLIAFSRLYLYVHFPSDVLASVIIGILIGTAGLLISKKLWKKRKSPGAGIVN